MTYESRASLLAGVWDFEQHHPELAVNESEFQQSLVDLAQRLGYRVAHFRPAQTSKGWRTPVSADGKGFPDLIIVGHGRIIAIECKSDKGRIAPEQLEWLSAMGAAGVTAMVARPRDWDDVAAILTEGAGRKLVTN